MASIYTHTSSLSAVSLTGRFLVINTSAITLIPATAIAIRASLGSANPQKIVVPAIMAATVATIVGVTTVKLIQYFQHKRRKGSKIMAEIKLASFLTLFGAIHGTPFIRA